jgi:hypothetical protein
VVELDETCAGSPPRKVLAGAPPAPPGPTGRGTRRPLLLVASQRGGPVLVRRIACHSREAIDAVLAGLLASAMFQNIALEELYYRFIDTIDPGVILFVTLKSQLFGVSIAVIACHNGLTMPRSVTAIPVAGIKAVMRSLLVVFSLDALLAAVRFLL